MPSSISRSTIPIEGTVSPTMTIEWIPILLLLSTLSGAKAHVAAQAASCNTSDVQAAINSAAEGGTVTIPTGTCTWTSGVTVSGKGISIQGAGAGRIIAQSTTTSNIATGSQTLSLTGGLVNGVINISNGETLTISET